MILLIYLFKIKNKNPVKAFITKKRILLKI